MRRFLQGLGLGLLVAAIVMGIGTRKGSSTANESVVEQARELGMVFPKDVKSDDTDAFEESLPPEPTVATEAASGAGVKGAGVGGNSDSNVEDSTEATQEPTESPKPTQKPKKKKVEKPEESLPPAEGPNSTPRTHKILEPGTVVNFTVRDGLVSSSIAREMYEQGIIDDMWEFDHYITRNNLGRSIINGTYELKAGDSYANIARIITHG